MQAVPPPQGLYDGTHEHDACGVAFVATLRGTPGRDIVLAEDTGSVLALLDAPPARRDAMAEAARTRILGAHTSAHRAERLEVLLLMQPKRL